MEKRLLNSQKIGSLQWVSPNFAVTDATYSCDSQSIFASFDDGSVSIFTAAALKLRCRVNPAAYLPSNPRYESYQGQ